MQKLFLAFLFLLIITQSCGLDNFVEEEARLLSITTPATLELFGKKNEPLVLDFSQIIDFSQPLSLKIKKNPEKGMLTFVEKSSFLIYEPNESQSYSTERDSFVYQVTYTNNQTVEGQVFITLYDENTNIGSDSCKIKAAYDYAQTPPNTTLSINILENDIFCDDNIDVSSTFININAHHGDLILDNGKATYTPDQDFVGYDEFIYTTCTNNGDCAPAIVRILVRETPECTFKLENDKYSIELNNQVLDADSLVWLWEIFQNDILCIDQVDWSTFKITKPTLQGEIFIVPTDSLKAVSFVPNFGFDGQDIFTYQVCDFSGTCYSANVLININNNIDFSASLNDDLFFSNTSDKQELAILSNDQIDKNTVDWTSFSIKNNPKNGTAKVEQNSNGEYIISYTANQNFSNVDKLSYGLCLFSGECLEAEVKIIVQPDNYICPTIAPLAKNDTIILNSGQDNVIFETIPVLENDDFCFAKVDWETFEIITSPQYGSVEVNIGENIRYHFDKNKNYSSINQDRFTYRWTQDGQSFEATVLIKFENNVYGCADIITVDSLDSDNFDHSQIIAAEIEGDELIIILQYIGGCDFELNTHYLVLKEEEMSQNIPRYTLKYFFKDSGKCLFVINEVRCFDLSVFKNPVGGTAIIDLDGYGIVIYKY